ncbi:MAG TPA: hypothetical protein VFP72_11890 [Kineosporiaceae bacterium]|nr:hypothetical protein [Kineosporiaceae bacterium]
MSQANTALRQIRERTPSSSSPGEHLTRQELADLVNTEVEASTGRPGALDANYIGKLERGVITWPRLHYRAAFRTVLGVTSDRELGFSRSVRIGRQVAGLDHTPITGIPFAMSGAVAPDRLIDGLNQLPIAVSREHIESVHTAASMFTTLDHAHGGTEVANIANIYLNHTAELLRLPCPATLRPDLFSAVGWIGHIVGSAAFDATRHEQAAKEFAFALSCAEQGADWHLRARVLSSMAREAIWRGDPDTGLTWVELALVRADRLTATERAMLLTARARALARLGRVKDTMRTVQAADDNFHRSDPGEDPPWLTYYDLAQHLGDTGHALYDLAVHGHYTQEATRRLEAAFAGHKPLYVRSKAMSGLKLASLRFHTGDPIEGAEIGQTALRDLGGLRSARTVQVVRALDSTAAPHSRQHEVTRLRHELSKVITPP